MISFKLAERKIHELLTSEYTYEIPKFQREYSWEKEEVKQFIDDIFFMLKKISNFNNITEDYFLGTLVLIHDAEDAKNRIVIDGQQRLTTILILLNVLKEKFNNPKDKKEIQKYLYANEKEEKYKIKLNKTNNGFFTTFIQSFNSQKHKEKLEKELKNSSNSNKLIHKAYEILVKEVDLKIKEDEITEDKIDNFLTKILKIVKESFTIIEMSASTTQDASLIFETLNTRSKRLQLYEIIKNHIFGRMTSKNTEIENFWNIILEKYYLNLSKNFTSSFYTNYGLIKGDNNLFNYFIRNFSNENIDKNRNYYNFSFNLRRDVEILTNMRDPTITFFKKEKQVKILNLIRSFKVEQVYWVLLASYKMKFQFDNMLEIIKNFVFENKFSKNLPFVSRPPLAKIANKIMLKEYNKPEDLEKIKKELNKLTSSIKKIKINFIEDTISNTLAKSLMFEINNPDNPKLKLEHIYSKNNKSKEFRKAVNLIKKKKKFEPNSILNFTLTTSKINREASNKSFEEKIEIYKQEDPPTQTTRKLIELYGKHKSFNLNLINDYQDYLWKEIGKIFPL